MRHPLSWLPDIPVEQDDALARVWERVTATTSVQDGRPHGTPRGTAFAMCCVRVPLAALTPEFAELRTQLAALPMVCSEPDELLHIPIQELGYLTDSPQARDEINEARLQEFASVATIPVGEYPPFTIRVGGVNSFLDAPFLDIHDGGWLNRIHRRLLDIALVPTNTRYPYLPHITLGEYTENAPASALIETLRPWRETTFGEFAVTDIEICTRRTDDRDAPFDVRYTLPLATATTVTPFTSAPNSVPSAIN